MYNITLYLKCLVKMATGKTIFLTIPLHNSSHYKIYKVQKMPNIVGALNPCFFLKIIYYYTNRNSKNGTFIGIYTCMHRGGKERGVWVNALSKRLFEI